jgi:hypothetical protein
MDLPTRRYVVIATYENPLYAQVEWFETGSELRAQLVAKAIAGYWRNDLEMFGPETQKFWTVVVEEPEYWHAPEGFRWHVRRNRHGKLLDLYPSHSMRRFTDDQDLARGVD